jgi:pimeloyl-ACP methyl ester carboxylesterase
MPFADLNGVRLFYTDDEGHAPPILLVHGWLCDSTDWSWQLDAFAGRHRVIAPDLRGHGRSSEGGDYALETFAHDLALLLDELDARPAVVVGHSLGGAVASILAVEHPEHVRALVLVDPAIGLGAELEPVARSVAPALAGPEGFDFLIRAFSGMEGPDTPGGLVTWHRRRALGFPQAFMVDTWRAQEESGVLYRPDADRYLARRACPVLSVYAGQERADWEGRLLSDPHSRALAWSGVGHWLHQERPDELNRLVLDWIAALADHAGEPRLADAGSRA